VYSLADQSVALVHLNHLRDCRFFPALYEVAGWRAIFILGFAGVGRIISVPRRRGVTLRPVDYIDGPSANFLSSDLVSGAPVQVRVAQGLARNISAAIEGQALTRVCADADLNRSTVQQLLAGRGYCDIVTVAKLEAVLAVSLWPGSV
jgi:hypothetical protein